MQGALNWKTMRVVYVRHLSFFSLKSSTQLHNHCRIIVEENSVKYVPLDGFFRIQILPNSISAGALSRFPLGRLTTLPQTAYSRLGRGTPPPHFSPPRRLRRLAHRASPLFKTFRRPWRTRSVHVARPASRRLEFANFARTFPVELIHVFRTQWPVCC